MNVKFKNIYPDPIFRVRLKETKGVYDKYNDIHNDDKVRTVTT